MNWLSTLDALRGLAAVYVVCHHARVLLLVSLQEARGGPPAVRAVATAGAALAFGHQAVIFFFVLSGFCIHFRQAKNLAGPTFHFDARSFFWRRLRRIVPPFYFALILTGLLAAVARAANPAFLAKVTAAATNSGTANPFKLLIVQHGGTRTFLGNLLFLQALVVPTFGNNTALWSLAYEFYLYALYPPYLAIRRAVGVWGSAAIVLGVSSAAMAIGDRVAGSWWGPVPVLAYWFCWVLGATAAEVYLGGARLPKAVTNPFVLAVLVAGWFATIRMPDVSIVVSDTLGALACTLVLLACLRHAHEPRGIVRRAAFRWFLRAGRYSYSLYLTHIPVLSLICSLWFLNHDAMPRQPWIWAAGVLIALWVGQLTFWLVERHFVRS